MSFGFRVYEVGLVQGPAGRTRLDFADPLGDRNHFFLVVRTALATLESQGTLSCMPDLVTPGADHRRLAEEGDPQIRFETVDVNAGKVSFRVRYGFHGEFDRAFGDGRDDGIDLTAMAATTWFRCDLYVPHQGFKGALVVEAIGSRCPVAMVTGWLGRESYERDSSNWCRLRVQQVADRGHLRQMLRSSENVELTLTRTSRSSDSSLDVDPVRLVQKVKSDLRREGLVGLATSWLSDESEDEAVFRVEEIAGYDPELLGRAGLHFSDAAITVQDRDGKSRTFRPGKIREAFTYQISQDVRPDDVTWRDRTTQKVRETLSDEADINIQ